MSALHVSASDRGSAAVSLVRTDFDGEQLATGEVALPFLDDVVGGAVLARFHAAVVASAGDNRERRAFWFTWLSSHDRLHAPLHDELLLLERVERALALASPTAARLVVDDGVLGPALVRHLRGQGHDVRVGAGDRLRWWVRRRRAAAQGPATTVRLLVRMLRQRASARKLGSPVDHRGHDVVLVSLFDGRAPEARPGPHLDRYFGDLAAQLEATGSRAVVCGAVIDDVGPWLRYLAEPHDGAVLALPHLLTRRDIVAGALLAASVARLRVPTSLDPAVPRPLLRRSLRHDPLAVMEGELVRRGIGRLLDANPHARVVHMYENNAWERGVDLAARVRDRDVRGYLHCAINPAHPKYFVDPTERALRPAPATIICTGSAARDVLLELGAHEPSAVLAGCTLRQSPLPDEFVRDHPPKRARRLLVLLEGLWTMTHVVRFVDQARAGLPDDVTVVLRGHPVLSAEVIAARAGVGLGGAMTACREPDLVRSILDADVVLYRSSTTALTAASLGVPIIHLAGATPLPEDPLFRCDALKRTARQPADLAGILAELEHMDGAAFLAEREAVRAYVARYLAEPGSEALLPFLATTGG